jgi:lipopolysaccharide export system permease protein
MIPGILFRMILGDLLKVFLLALVALTGMFLMAGLIAEALQRGLAPAQILAFIPLLIPNTLPYTIPATTLFAACFVYGRLAADNEITALRATGVHLFRVILPCLLLGAAVSALTLWLYYAPIPWTHQALKRTLSKDVQKLLYSELSRKRCLRDPKLDFVLFVREVRGERLIDAVFKKKKKLPDIGYEFVARAREAELTVDLPKRLIRVDMDRCVMTGEKTVDGVLSHRAIDVDLPPNLFSEPAPRAGDMTVPELFERRITLAGEQVQTAAGINRLLARGAEQPNASHFDQHQLLRDRDTAKHQENEQRSLTTELYMRPAMALGCLCFVAVGCPVGIWFSKADYLSSFVTCFLPTVFVYYPLMLAGGNLARNGKFPTLVSTFAADAVLAVAALVLTWRLLRK